MIDPAEHAALQREAVATAVLHLDGDGFVHVYGAKLYGAPSPGEYHCAAAQPFTGQRAVVVFHADVRPIGWTGDHYCAACGTGSNVGDA
jgi:hypothetical protein